VLDAGPGEPVENRWRILVWLSSPLTAKRRLLLQIPVTPSIGVDVCLPGDHVAPPPAVRRVPDG
jgi:hypothetical protein